MIISALGPEGTYSMQAARQHDPEAELLLAGSIPEAIDMVSAADAEQGVVPIENSIQGIVTQTFDGLFDGNLYIRGETVLDIHHALAGLQVPDNREDIRKIYSHPQALAQCRRFFAKWYPEAELVETASTAGGMKTVAGQEDLSALAVGPDFAAGTYGLTIIEEEIEDESSNQTRFVAFSKEASIDEELDFVMISVIPHGDRPGLIHDITGAIHEQGVNLSDLHSRPRRDRLGSYKFYMRLDMSSKDDDTYGAISAAIKACGNQVVRMSA